MFTDEEIIENAIHLHGDILDDEEYSDSEKNAAVVGVKSFMIRIGLYEPLVEALEALGTYGAAED
jgi:hypothetical protein